MKTNIRNLIQQKQTEATEVKLAARELKERKATKSHLCALCVHLRLSLLIANSVSAATRANNWGETQKLTATDGIIFDTFGVSVALSAGVALVGAPFDDVVSQDQGSAYVFLLPIVRLLSPAWVNGEFQVTLTGTTGLTYSLQSSINFVDWIKVTDATLSTSPMFIRVPATADSGFYRTVTPPVPRGTPMDNRAWENRFCPAKRACRAEPKTKNKNRPR